MDNTKGFSYLASPYSVVNPSSNSQAGLLRHKRFVRACKMAEELMEQGENIFCPIAHSHSIDTAARDNVHDSEFWLKQDLSILQYAKELIVFQMYGWEKSEGIKREIQFATDLGIPVRYLPNKVFVHKYIQVKPNKRNQGASRATEIYPGSRFKNKSMVL